MTGPRLHPRQQPVALAQSEIEIAFWQAVEKAEPELTYVETMQILASLERSCLKAMLRWERHGDYEKPAGWAYEEEEE